MYYQTIGQQKTLHRFSNFGYYHPPKRSLFARLWALWWGRK